MLQHFAVKKVFFRSDFFPKQKHGSAGRKNRYAGGEATASFRKPPCVADKWRAVCRDMNRAMSESSVSGFIVRLVIDDFFAASALQRSRKGIHGQRPVVAKPGRL